MSSITANTNSLILERTKSTGALQVLENGKTSSYNGRFRRLVEGFGNGSPLRPGIRNAINSRQDPVVVGMKANTCIDTTSRYAVGLGYYTTFIQDCIATLTWEEIEATVEVNFPNYGHALLSTEEFVNALKQRH